MSLVINHNMMAANAARNMNNSYSNLSTSVRRLSSGLRIGSAADDAAGLAIRELMRADVASFQQGVRNAMDAISLIQTADGAMQVIDDKLIRMKELAEQAATGTYNSDQRLIIDSEFQSMASEITRIATATEFNGIYLLNGNLSSNTFTSPNPATGVDSHGKLKVHFGTGNDSAEDYYYVKIGEVSASALGLGNSRLSTATDAARRGGSTLSTQGAAGASLAAVNNAIISKDLIRAHIGSMQNRLEATVANLQIMAENLQASESRISDVDVATEMTEFTRQQILTQSANAMIAQANALPQMAMQLIQG